jgi:hypothetical protein
MLCRNERTPTRPPSREPTEESQYVISHEYCGKECQGKAWKEHKKVCGLKADGTTEALVRKREHRMKKKGGEK